MFGRRTTRPGGSTARWPGSGFEALERRSLMATVTWDGGAGDANWFTPQNWNGNILPTAGDDVVITNPGVVVRFSTAGMATVNRLTMSNAALGVLGGTLRVMQAAAGGGVLVAGGGSEVAIDGGLVEVQISATFDGSELVIRSGDLTSPATVIRNGFLDLYSDGTGDFFMRGTSYLTGDVSEDRVVTVQGVLALPATVYWASGDRINAGVITLNSSAAVNVTLRVLGTLVNQGTMNFNAGPGGARKYTGGLVNYSGLGGGVINISAGTTFGGPDASYTNIGGSITVAAGAALTIAAPNAVFTLESGTFAVNGTFTMAGNNGTFDYQGGTISGTPLVILGATLSLGFDANGPAHFQMRGGCTLHGIVKAGHTITVQGITALGARLDWQSGLINGGTITLTSIAVGSHALLVSELAPFNNQGTLSVLAGAGGNRTITGGLTNYGTISLGAGTTFAGDNVLYSFQPTGSVSGSGALILSTIGRILGGTMSGTGNLAVTETGRLFVAVSGTLATTRPVNNRGEIWVDGGTFNPTGGVLQLTNGLLTGGLWNLRGSAAITFPSAVRTIGAAASVGVIGPTATFNALTTLRRVDGELTIGAGRNLVLNPFGGAFTNNGTVRIEAGGTLTLGSASYVQTAAGTLDLDVAGLAAASFGRIVTTGAASLAGTLICNYVSGFVPASGNVFQFLTAGSRTGTFPLTYLPATPATVVQYLVNGARLTV